MILLVFPHQLFQHHPGLRREPRLVCLIEDALFFGDVKYPVKFHKQKLWLHRATMQRYAKGLEEDYGLPTKYFEYQATPNSLRDHMREALRADPSPEKRSAEFVVCDPTDFILAQRLRRNAKALGANITFLPTPMFLNTQEQNHVYRRGKKRWSMADFYKSQRRRLAVLVDENDEPVGGKWSFDTDNRKKIPKSLLSTIPPLLSLKRDAIDREAQTYTEARFGDHPGELEDLPFPTSHRAAKQWLTHFLTTRLQQFGDFEDAIEQGES